MLANFPSCHEIWAKRLIACTLCSSVPCWTHGDNSHRVMAFPLPHQMEDFSLRCGRRRPNQNQVMEKVCAPFHRVGKCLIELVLPRVLVFSLLDSLPWTSCHSPAPTALGGTDPGIVSIRNRDGVRRRSSLLVTILVLLCYIFCYPSRRRIAQDPTAICPSSSPISNSSDRRPPQNPKLLLSSQPLLANCSRFGLHPPPTTPSFHTSLSSYRPLRRSREIASAGISAIPRRGKPSPTSSSFFPETR